jgi:S-adenosylmethionine synthetase
MDIKVAGVRIDDNIEITVNMPLISTLVSSMKKYWSLTKVLESELLDFYKQKNFSDVKLNFNPQNISGIPYLSVTGSVADTGDVGVVGRGNRPNGLITPMRPMSIEAVCGKSPIDNTGKLYGVVANRIAKAVHKAMGSWCDVTMVTFRDRSLDDPAYVLVSLDAVNSVDFEAKIRKIIEKQLAQTPSLTKEFIIQGITSW